MSKNVLKIENDGCFCCYVSTSAIPAMAQEDSSNTAALDNSVAGCTICNFSFSVDGCNGASTPSAVKTRDHNAPGRCYRVNLNHNQGTGPGYNVVMNSYMRNSNHQDRGFGQTFQGTANTIGNSASAGYTYYLRCYRQYTTDTQKVTFSGSWSPDEY